MTTPPQQQAGPGGQVAPPERPTKGAPPRPPAVRDHSVARPGLSQIDVPQPAGGSVLLGFAAPWRPVHTRLFRGETTRVAVVGGTYVAGLIAFRSLAIGALTHVATPRPRAWRQLTGPACAGRVAVAQVGAKPQVRASMRWPALVINDTGPDPGDPSPSGPAWQTTMTLLPTLTEGGAAALYQADVVVLHRCTADEAQIACDTLGLDRKHVSWLGSGPEDGLALVSGGAVTYVCLGVTRDEYNLFGAPVRQDRTAPGTGGGTGLTGPLQAVQR